MRVSTDTPTHKCAIMFQGLTCLAVAGIEFFIVNSNTRKSGSMLPKNTRQLHNRGEKTQFLPMARHVESSCQSPGPVRQLPPCGNTRRIRVNMVQKHCCKCLCSSLRSTAEPPAAKTICSSEVPTLPSSVQSFALWCFLACSWCESNKKRTHCPRREVSPLGASGEPSITAFEL